jgi:1-acyl-sn-glycerol-3-phosphate acyltransferase
MSDPRFPPLPDLVPRVRGKTIMRWVGSLIARSSSWRIEPLPNVSKAVIVAAPHSSNWDGIFGVCGAFTLGVEIRWMGKSQLFRWPLSIIMHAFNGIKTDRNYAGGVVAQIAAEFAARDRMWLVLAPEGTRKKVRKWRTGFWHIAKRANVPIIPGFLHYPEKKIGFGEPFMPSDLESDLARLYAFYSQFQGKNGKTALPLDC